MQKNDNNKDDSSDSNANDDVKHRDVNANGDNGEQDMRSSDGSVHQGLFGQNGNSTCPRPLPWLSGQEEDKDDVWGYIALSQINIGQLDCSKGGLPPLCGWQPERPCTVSPWWSWFPPPPPLKKLPLCHLTSFGRPHIKINKESFEYNLPPMVMYSHLRRHLVLWEHVIFLLKRYFSSKSQRGQK